MKQVQLEVKENKALTANVYQMLLAGDNSEIPAPGQFVNLKMEGL